MASMMRFRWNKPCAADSCWLTSPGKRRRARHGPRGHPRQGSRGDLPGPVPSARQCTPQRWGEDSPRERLLITARPGHRVVSAGRLKAATGPGGDVEMGQAAGSPCGSRPSAWAEVTYS